MRQACILTINGGSSSIRFGLYLDGKPLKRLLHGEIDRIGLKGSALTFSNEKENQLDTLPVVASDRSSAARFLMDWLEKQPGFSAAKAVVHRVVHGLNHINPQRIATALLDELRSIISYDLDHLPIEIELIDIFRRRYPNTPQVACFDTAFHSTMLRVAKLLPIPRRFDEKGIRRYGFHGLSYAFLMGELARVAGVKAAQGRVILIHLGNGASPAAIR